MTRADLLEAFSLRLDGMSFAEIGEQIGYTESAVHKALYSALSKPDKSAAILYPQLREYVRNNCDGSIVNFANALQISHYRLHRAIVCGDPIPPHLKEKITQLTNLSEKEAFAL